MGAFNGCSLIKKINVLRKEINRLFSKGMIFIQLKKLRGYEKK